MKLRKTLQKKIRFCDPKQRAKRAIILILKRFVQFCHFDCFHCFSASLKCNKTISQGARWTVYQQNFAKRIWSMKTDYGPLISPFIPCSPRSYLIHLALCLQLPSFLTLHLRDDYIAIEVSLYRRGNNAGFQRALSVLFLAYSDDFGSWQPSSTKRRRRCRNSTVLSSERMWFTILDIPVMYGKYVLYWINKFT